MAATGMKSLTLGGRAYSVRAIPDPAYCELLQKDAGRWAPTGINRYYRPHVLMTAVLGCDPSKLSEADMAALHALACAMTDEQ